MNGQPDQPLNQGEPSPASFGALGFGGQQAAPGASAWNPAAIPTPGPISGGPALTPVPSAPAVAPIPSLEPMPLSVTPAERMAPMPSPFVGAAPAAVPVAPSFSPFPEAQAFKAPSFGAVPPAPAQAEPMMAVAPIPAVPVPPFVPQPAPAPAAMPSPFTAPAPQTFEAATITPRSFEAPAPAAAPAMPSPFTAPVVSAPVPPPPSAASTIDLRTMASDVSSLQATGGAEAVPQSFSPEAFTSDTSAVFSPAEAAAAQVEKPKSKTGKILLIAGIVVVILAAGAGAYFLLAGKKAAAPETPEVAAPAAEVPAPEVPAAAVPPVEGTAPQGEQPAVPEQPSRSHSSFFTTPSDKVEQKVIPSVSLEEVKKAFYASEEGVVAPADGFMKEIVLTKSGAGFINFSEFLGVFLPEISQDSVKALFAEDFTSFVYQDRTNPMTGFIALVKPESAPEASVAFSSSLEASKNIGSFYAKEPGDPAASWKGGFVSGKPVQYLAFPKVGYAFDYGWFKDQNGKTYLVVSTSYAGMREAVKRAGL